MARQPDLIALGIALPVFVLAGWPLLGYAVCAAAWLAQKGLQLAAGQRAAARLAAGDRGGALGFIAGATLARVWLVALSILLVGKLSAREDGLAAALLAATLVTIYIAAAAIARIVDSEGEAA